MFTASQFDYDFEHIIYSWVVSLLHREGRSYRCNDDFSACLHLFHSSYILLFTLCNHFLSQCLLRTTSDSVHAKLLLERRSVKFDRKNLYQNSWVATEVTLSTSFIVRNLCILFAKIYKNALEISELMVLISYPKFWRECGRITERFWSELF